MILGNEKANKILEELLKRDTLSICLSGPEGLGKKSKALELIGQILKVNTDEAAVHADLFFVEPTNSLIKLEKIRELIEFSYLKSYSGGRKFALINDAHLMNTESQNALLKLLEDPPEGQTIILITHKYDELLSTIRSRLIKVSYQKLTDDEIKTAVGRDLSTEVLILADGSVAKAKYYMDYDMSGLTDFVRAFLYRDGNYTSKDPDAEEFKVMATYAICVLKEMRKISCGGKSDLHDANIFQNKLQIRPEIIDRLLLKLDQAMSLYMGNFNKKNIFADLMMGSF